MLKKHTNKRTKCNISLLKNTFLYLSTPLINNWKRSLTFFTRTKYHPMPFRRSNYDRARYSLCREVHECF